MIKFQLKGKNWGKKDIAICAVAKESSWKNFIDVDIQLKVHAHELN
jgi:hypothetical protein